VHPYALPASHASSVDAGRGCGLVRKPGSQLPFAPQVSSHLGDGRQGVVGRHFGIAAAQGFASPLNHFTAYWLVVDLLAQSMCFGEKAYKLDLLLDHR